MSSWFKRVQVRNIAVGVVARGIDWKGLRLAETADSAFGLLTP